jgi:hypothetical protein
VPAMKHYHIYARLRKDNFSCIDPRCTHKDWRKAIEGKFAVCPFGDPAHPHLYRLDREALRLALPHCKDCSGRDGPAPRKVEVIESNIFPDKSKPSPRRNAGTDKPGEIVRTFLQTNAETGKIEPMAPEAVARIYGSRAPFLRKESILRPAQRGN